MNHPWASTPEQVLQHFGVDASRGLTADHAAKHAEVYGRNGQSS
jgi:Ca2+ transporting ATPase